MGEYRGKRGEKKEGRGEGKREEGNDVIIS